MSREKSLSARIVALKCQYDTNISLDIRQNKYIIKINGVIYFSTSCLNSLKSYISGLEHGIELLMNN